MLKALYDKPSEFMNENLISSIQESVLCWLATVDEHGMPNVSPKEVFTHFDDKIIIANIASPESAKNIASNGVACISFVNVFSQKGYKVKGSAKVLAENSEEYKECYKLLYKMTGEKFPIVGVLSITVESFHEVVAPSYKLYPGTTEQSQIESAYKTYGVRGRADSVV